MPGLFLIPLFVSLGIHFYLDSTAPLWFPLLFEIPLFLSYLEIKLQLEGRNKIILRTARIASFTLLIIGFLMFILMLPETLYQAWLLLLDAGKPTGMISFAFAYAGGLVSSVGCAALFRWKNKIQAILNLLLLCMMVFLILHPQLLSVSIFIILILFKLFLIQKENSKSMALHSLSITLIPALIVAFLLPILNDTPRGSQLVDNFSKGIQSSVSRIFPGLPLLFQIPGYGSTYDQVRKTGERPILSSNIIFSLEGEPGTILYLRSDVFYNYMRGFWVSDPPGIGLMVKKIPNENLYRKIQLTVETDIYTRVPHNSWTSYYNLDQEIRSLDSLGSYEPSSGLPLSRGDIITLYDNSDITLFPDEDIVKSQIERSLLLPAGQRESLAVLAKSMEGDNAVHSLSNIKRYLKKEFKYTLDTKSSENMVLDFLNKSKEGYCVHFSTTAALLARTLGIPVRIAEGFLVQIPYPEDGEIYYAGTSHAVTGYSAHQWPEVFVEGRGWIPWEVTPPFEALGDSLILEDANLDDFTREQLQHMGLLQEDEQGAKSSVNEIRPAFLTLLIVLIISFIISIVLLYKRSGLAVIIKRKIKKADKKYGIASPESIGWIQWFNRLALKTGENYLGLDLMLKYCYHKDSLEKTEKKELQKLLRKL